MPTMCTHWRPSSPTAMNISLLALRLPTSPLRSSIQRRVRQIALDHFIVVLKMNSGQRTKGNSIPFGMFHCMYCIPADLWGQKLQLYTSKSNYVWWAEFRGRSNVPFQRTYTDFKSHLPSVCGLLAGIPRTPHPSELSPYYPLSPGAVGSIAHPLGWFMPQ